jgi:hypothetical protein
MVALLGLAGPAQLPAQARETTVVRYDCNLDGAPAQLVAQVETVRPAGVFMGSDGRFGGAIDSGEVNYYYQGTLSSASARYSFTGENQFADFVDMTNNERFRVQFVVQGQQLLLIANPHGPGPRQYLCQRPAGSFGGTPAQPGTPAGFCRAGRRRRGSRPADAGGQRELGVEPTVSCTVAPCMGPRQPAFGRQVSTEGVGRAGARAPMCPLRFDVLGGPEAADAVPAAWASQSVRSTSGFSGFRPAAEADRRQQRVAVFYYCRGNAGCHTTPRCARAMATCSGTGRAGGLKLADADPARPTGAASIT